MATATNILNDGSAAGTQIVEATVLGGASSAVSLKNDGTLVLGNAAHPGRLSSDNNLFNTDGSGNVTAQSVTLNGTLSVTGSVTLSTTAVNKIGANLIPTLKVFNVTLTTSPQTIAHGFGAAPTWIGIVQTNNLSTSQTLEAITNITSISFTLNYVAANGTTITCAAIG